MLHDICRYTLLYRERCVHLNLDWCLIVEDDAALTRSEHQDKLRSLKNDLINAKLIDSVDIIWLGWYAVFWI